MKYYPIYIDLKNRNCLVVGGGSVSTRKVQTLLQCSAQVTVISPEASETLRTLARDNHIQWHSRTYRPSDLNNVFLVIGATDDQRLNRRVSTDAEKLGLLCNIADDPQACNFILPAIVQRGDLTISVSTAGKSPAFAKHLRKILDKQFGEEYGLFLTLMGAVRRKLLNEAHAPEEHKPLFEALINGGLLEKIAEKNWSAVDRLLENTVGPGYRYETMMAEADVKDQP